MPQPPPRKRNHTTPSPNSSQSQFPWIHSMTFPPYPQGVYKIRARAGGSEGLVIVANWRSVQPRAERRDRRHDKPEWDPGLRPDVLSKGRSEPGSPAEASATRPELPLDVGDQVDHVVVLELRPGEPELAHLLFHPERVRPHELRPEDRRTVALPP